MHHRTKLLLMLVLIVAIILSSSLRGHGLSQQQGHVINDSISVVGCREHERDALLEFKRGITSDPPGLLASWKPGGQEDCCHWRGVQCSEKTGHVTGLYLRNVHANETVFIDHYFTALVGQISPSLLSLQHLKHLDLSLNRLQGPTQRVPEFLGSLKNLRYLNLSGIPFYGTVPPQLGNLTKLHHLDLSSSNFIILDNGAHMNSTDLSWLTRLPLLYLNMGRSVNLSMVQDWAHVVNMVPSLIVLDLSGCSLQRTNQSLPHLNLTKLESLDISNNNFDHPVAPCWFWNLTSLSYLGVGGTNMYGQFHYALEGMTSLQVLDFSFSQGGIDIMTANMRNLCNLEIILLGLSKLDGNITKLFDQLSQCYPNKFKELHLDNNNFYGVLPNLIGRWSSLSILGLSENQITGPVPSEIGMLNSLNTLDLSENQITGPLPSEIGMLNSLNTLDLSNNLIIGEVPSEISMLGNLTDMNLSYNNLTGVITHEHLSGLKSLTTIDLSSNSLKIVVDTEWLPPFRLQYAYFAYCDMGPGFPTWLQSQIDINELDISSAGICDNLPDWFCSTFSNAQILNMANNEINGTLPANMEVMTSLSKLYLNSNNLTGSIPRFPEGLNILDISRNSLPGPLPSNFGAPYMEDLRLFSNRISGHVPNSMCGMQNLGILDIADNLLEGEFPECFQPQQFEMLMLSNNRFSGKFPPSLQRFTDLYILDLESNNFNGELPIWIGDMVNLEIVRLGHNNFSGIIPATVNNLTKLLNLDLAANSISGVLPRNLSNLKGMKAGNMPTSFGHYVPIMNFSVGTKGQESYYQESQVLKMVSIDLSSNFLIGVVPEEVTFLDGVINLNLSWNHLSGKIPDKIGVMQALESLDLSHNKLYGELPQSLSNLTYLSYLDLSQNNFTGRIPSGGQLDTLYHQNPFIYNGNIGLCGAPLPNECSSNSKPKHGDHERDEHNTTVLSFSFGLGIGYVVGLWLVFTGILFNKSWRIAYFCLFDKALDKVYVFTVVVWARWTKK